MSLIIALSGKKQSGKNTAGSYIAGRYLEVMGYVYEASVDDRGRLVVVTDEGRAEVTVQEGDFNALGYRGLKFYSFASSLKQMCQDLFGLTHKQCYGSDFDKNSLTTLRWEDMPATYRNTGTGFMTAREVLQHFGTEIVREMRPNAWVDATLAAIRRENVDLAIITDARFPNEIEGVFAAGGKTIRLLRNVAGVDSHPSETALDDYPLDRYSLVVRNEQSTIEQQNKELWPWITGWLEEAGCTSSEPVLVP